MRSLKSEVAIEKGLKISISKTEVVMYDFESSDQEIDRAKHIMKIYDGCIGWEW